MSHLRIVSDEEALLIIGSEPDLLLEILGVQWKLHKSKLKHSPYFASMFSGSWNETTQSVVRIEVPDENITVDALRTVLTTLYYIDELIELDQSHVIEVLAGAVFFQVDTIIAKCINVMDATLCTLNAVTYYNAACRYDLCDMKRELLQNWFPVNLLQLYYENSTQLGYINIELMIMLLSNSKLCVIKTEFSLYLLLRRWLLLLIHNTGEPLNTPACFHDRPEREGPFLSSSEGLPYTKVFRCLRLPYLVLCPLNRDTLITDRIIPEVWLLPAISAILDDHNRINNEINTELGVLGQTESLFQSICMRSAQLIKSYSESWRWNIIPVGLYLDWSVAGNRISLGLYRNCCLETQATKAFIEVTLYNLDDLCRIKVIHKSGLKRIEINDNSTHIPLWGYIFRETPAVISFNMLLDVMSIDMFNAPLTLNNNNSCFAMLEMERLN